MKLIGFAFILIFQIFSMRIAIASVSVTINIDQPEHHLASVQVAFPQSNKKTLDIKLPNWRTGRYEILNLSNGIREFQAVDIDGNSLSWRKINKSTWQIDNSAQAAFSIHYQVYANQLGKRTRHIDDSHAFLNASAVVMYHDDSRNMPHIVDLNVPKSWRSVSGLPYGENKHQFKADSYDQLVDAPIETGLHQYRKFSIDKRDYELVIWGQGFYKVDEFIKDLSELVKQGGHFFGEYPFQRYVFILHITSGERGATEHQNSTIIQRSRFELNTRKDYISLLSTASHEFFHTWNIKQYAPQGVFPYDYQKENYSKLLWLVEGSTSYFQDLLLLRAKLITPTEFFDEIAKKIEKFSHKPGRASQSIAQASFNKWQDEGGDYGNNHSVNIYAEGYLTSWLLDFNLLEETRLKVGYSDIHKALFKHFRLPKTYNEQDIKNLLLSMTDRAYDEWWQKYVEGIPKVNFHQLLMKAGLALSLKKQDINKVWTGITTKQQTTGLEIIKVEKNSPAWQSGLTTGDVIVSIDNLRIKGKSLTQRLDNFNVDDEVLIHFFRRDELMSKTLILGKLSMAKLKLRPIKKPSKQQKKFYKAWTHTDLPRLN